MSKSKTIYFGEIPVGEEHMPIFLPDIDMYFNQDLKEAKRTVSILLESGVRVIKGAVLHREDIALDDGTMETYYSSEAGSVTENYRKLIERKVISLNEHEQIFRIVKEAGCELVLSVYDEEAADFAKDIGATAIKMASSNITFEKLVTYTARMGLPMIIDTGKSSLEEIARSVQWAMDAGVKGIVIEHSPLAPPVPVSQHNLRMIQTFKKLFQCPVGLSDHHCGDEMLFSAVALGASVLEKGVCADDQGVDQDVYHAIRVSQVKDVVEKCNNIYEALGSNMRYLRKDRDKPIDRMGMVASCDLSEGDMIDEDKIIFSFPARGIGAEYWSQVKGWKIRKSVKKDNVINWSDVEPLDS